MFQYNMDIFKIYTYVNYNLNWNKHGPFLF
jgi:hypothetical protein